MKRWLMDWWRGWSDEDLASAIDKVDNGPREPGSVIRLSMRELRAHISHYRVQP